MYTPFAYKASQPKRHEDVMLSVLNKLNTKYCSCNVGAAGDKVGYLSPGTCLDYAYDKLSVPYSFAFEIYSATQSIPAMRTYQTLLQAHAGHKKSKVNKNY